MKRFSIRDMLWLTMLCAVLLAWWIDHRRNYRPYYYEATPAGDILLHDEVRDETIGVAGVSWPNSPQNNPPSAH